MEFMDDSVGIGQADWFKPDLREIIETRATSHFAVEAAGAQ
ncbi:hypothetical protein BSU04_16790 [Caballeronia sordidicola]|uniref:Uncharacterized protein n=1 Tax=Caballeronia sordidicola TaxID=196367 RepID=A0A226X2W6_CABSO|nr:hypothetical protein BSU04_16790 [Caballeronia sordidicola]